MVQKLHQILRELTEISGVCFGLYESPEIYVDGTLPEEELPEAEVLQELFARPGAESAGYAACALKRMEEPMLLVAAGTRETVGVVLSMAASHLSLYFSAVKSRMDKNAFVASFLEGEIPRGELYRQAGRHKLRDVPRVFYLFELAKPLADTGALQMLADLFANDRQDLVFLQDETHLVLIKAFEKESGERAEEIARAALDTMLSELMIPTRVGYGTMKNTLAELPEGRREAALALRISAIFQKNREVACYARLGIARLIYELPRDVCEQFLHEVFGERLPEPELDEEMQVTVRLFIKNNLNISETARQLFLHRNTLVYRLERFEKLIGLDIRKFDDAMTFQIAMMVLANYRRNEDEICE